MITHMQASLGVVAEESAISDHLQCSSITFATSSQPGHSAAKKKKMLKEVLKSYQPIKTCMSTAGWMDRSPAGEIQYKPILDGSDPNFNSSFFFSVIVFMDIVFLMALSSILYKTAQ